MRPPFRVALLLLTLLAVRAAAQTDGIFADFTTSLGSFTCRLDPERAPKTVANFIGLATGQRAWLDEPTGAVRRDPYFDGLTFHRVIRGFMNQGGSRNGEGTDGPGYVFPDETAGSGLHDAPGVLSSANSGPNSNGSQFFVTAAAAAWLNGLHTVFGRVTEGLDVIEAINQVPTTAGNDRPVTPVILQSVRIRRVGSAAEAFDIHAQGLPEVTGVVLGAGLVSGSLELTHPAHPFTDTRLFSTTNWTVWTGTRLGIQPATPAPGIHRVAPTNSAAFHQSVQIRYPGSTRAPLQVRNRTLRMDFGTTLGVIEVVFDGAAGGTYTYQGANPGTITRYEWSQEPYRGRLWPILYSGLVPMTLRLDFTSEDSGTIQGTAFPTGNQIPVSGTFTLSP